MSIDGGGIRGIVPLRILIHLKRLTRKEPYQWFDVICGTSTGGILALLLGVLKIDVERTLEIYKELGEQVFPLDEQAWLKKAFSLVTNKEMYRSDNLENILKTEIKRAGHIEDQLLSSTEIQPSSEKNIPHVFEVTKRDETPYLFRNYADTIDHGATGTNKVKIWEAARATSAAPAYFNPITIGGHDYTDGGLGYNNPTSMAWDEVKRIA